MPGFGPQIEELSQAGRLFCTRMIFRRAAACRHAPAWRDYRRSAVDAIRAHRIWWQTFLRFRGTGFWHKPTS